MKILSVFNHYLERGGEAVAVDSICHSLTAVAKVRRCDFSSATWTGSDAPGRLQQAMRMMKNSESLTQLRRSQQTFRADAWLVHNAFPVGSAALYPQAHRWGVPVIQYLHNFRPFSVNGYLWANGRLASEGLQGNYWPEIRAGAWKDSKMKTAWFASVLWMSRKLGWWSHIKAWIAISEFMRQRFIEAGIPADDIFTLPHFWKPAPFNHSQTDGEHYLFLGRLIEPKGILVLLEAWKIIEKQLGRRAPQLVIGGEGPLYVAVKARAEKTLRVSVRGSLSGEEKKKALANARALIVPSIWWEPLGLVVYEAYDAGVPVLAARSGGLSETVVDNLTGLLHEPGNSVELAHHVMHIESDRARSCAMGQAGRSWLEANASEALWRDRFLKIASFALS